MEQHPAHIEKLLNKYVNNTASLEEVHELITYFTEKKDEMVLEELISGQLEKAAVDAEVLDSYTQSLLTERFERIKEEIRNGDAKEVSVRRHGIPMRAIAIAASIVVLFCVGMTGYYLDGHLADLHGPPREDVIMAGSNRAVLIMEDGSELELDGGKQGIIVGAGITYDDGTSLQTARSSEADNMLSKHITLVTPRGGQYQIILSDGTHVWLNANSSLIYPVRFDDGTREVTLKGEAYFDVTHNGKRPFRVNLNDTKIEVLGTQFNVNGYRAVTATLVEGSVKVIHESGQRFLKPGEGAEVGQNIRVYPADIQKAIAWKNGFFHFKDDQITDILDQIARWYDIEVVYQQESAIPQDSFNGKIRRQANLSEVLEMLNYISGADFDINGREVTVTF